MKSITFHIIIVSMCFLPMQTWACSCGKSDVREQIEHSDIIFLGRFEDVVEKNEYVKHVYFNVIDAWKGQSEKKVIIKQGRGIDCSRYFDQLYIGSYFLIFADELSSSDENNEKIYWTSACGGAERIDTENNTIEYLNDKFN